MVHLNSNEPISEDFVLNRIEELCQKYDMSRYRLAMKSGVDQATLSMIFNKRTVPTVFTIDKLCNAFGITIAQFFSEEGEHLTLTNEQRSLLDNWRSLDEKEKAIVTNYMSNLLASAEQKTL